MATTHVTGVVEKDMAGYANVGEHMKTSIFDMNFTLPPMLEMVEVEKDMPQYTHTTNLFCGLGDRYENINF